MADASRTQTRPLTLTDAFGPERRWFNIFKRVWTTALVTSFAMILALFALTPFFAMPLWREVAILSVSGCTVIVSTLLTLAAAVILLLSQRARYMIRFWLGLCLCPLFAILALPVMHNLR